MSRPGILSLLLLSSCGGAAPITAAPIVGATDATAPPPRALSMGETRAAFDPSDPTNDEGAHVHVWRIELDPSRRVRVHVRSDQVDPMVELSGPNGQHLHNDDAFPTVTLDALLDFVPSEAGTYELRTTTAGPGQVGPYSILVEAREPSGLGLAHPLGQRSQAALGQHGQPGLPGSWLHFEGQGGSIVRLRVTSPAFDTIATLIGPGGQTWVNDDANDLGPDGRERTLDSTIVAALPQTGIYQLVVTSYGPGQGPFAVRSEVRPPVVIGQDGRRPEGLAGPDGGRLLGLYVGITAYQNQSPLYGCADDARMLAEALRASRVQDETDQLVLPDGLATREAFLGGLRQIAERARPEDVVLLFYSGHGQQVPDTDTENRELDGLDETLVLFDGSLTDDEVVRAIDPIRAGTIVLAIDACHAGGFAEDFVTRPGRMGLFSSDEDVLSDTAQPHRAGGYLSWHLRRGVLGEADSRPRDGVLSAGELSDYLLDGYVADHRLMNPPHELDRAQRLVVRRGAVGWDHLLWIYPRDADLGLPPVPSVPLTSHPPR